MAVLQHTKQLMKECWWFNLLVRLPFLGLFHPQNGITVVKLNIKV